MAREPDNLVLQLLREIRATLDLHTAKFVEIDKRFDGVDKRLDTLTSQVTYTFGIAGMANTHIGLVENRVDGLADWKKQVDAKQADLERRLARVEEKV
jgi:tetrahydromethanopterin S-methyltransferase subunit G